MIVSILSVLFFIIIGSSQPSRLVQLFIWTYPYIGGNAIFGWIPPRFSPALSIGIAIVGIGFLRFDAIWKFRNICLLKYLLHFLLYCTLITTINLVFLDKEFLSYWNQPPLVRGFISLGNEIFFWTVPILSLALTFINFQEKQIEKYLKTFIYTGCFYTIIGLCQFVISLITGEDVFPIVRSINPLVLQPIAAGGLAGRITSICGEPRYFSAFTVLWFSIMLFAGNKLGFKAVTQMLVCSLFATGLLLSGSRTGVLGLCVVLAVMVFCQALGYVKFLTGRQIFSLFVVSLIASFIFAQNTSAIATRGVTAQENIFNETISLGFVKLPMEYQDSESLKALTKSYFSMLTGLGAGLWQYHFNPFTNQGLVTVYQSRGINSLDSVKPNIGLIHRLSSYGLIGLSMILLFYIKFLNIWSLHLSIKEKKHLFGTLIIFLTVIQIVKLSEVYAQLATILLLCFFRQNFEYKKFNQFIMNNTSYQSKNLIVSNFFQEKI